MLMALSSIFPLPQNSSGITSACISGRWCLLDDGSTLFTHLNQDDYSSQEKAVLRLITTLQMVILTGEIMATKMYWWLDGLINWLIELTLSIMCAPWIIDLASDEKKKKLLSFSLTNFDYHPHAMQRTSVQDLAASWRSKELLGLCK